MGATPADAPLNRTPLFDLHVSLGAKMVPFAGYEMPVQYPTGILKEHLHTREKAGLFDVSHMGQAFLIADDRRHETVARALEQLVPADMLGLKLGQQRYTQLLDMQGGCIDDLMVTRSHAAADDGSLMLVVNASRKAIDYEHIAAKLPAGVRFEQRPERALLALQGPGAAGVMARLSPKAAALGFMSATSADIAGFPCHVSRSGYTGEDGFEISVAADKVADLAKRLLAEAGVLPIGLGARDSLRLEAGLCLYGHELDESISPIEADLGWSIQKRRRQEGGFPGAARILQEISQGPRRKRVGIRPEGRQPVRDGAKILDAAGREIGVVTSGGFGPSLNAPVAMGYVETASAALGTPLQLVVRGKPMLGAVAPLPFVAHRYARKA